MNQEARDPVATEVESLAVTAELATLEEGAGQGMAPAQDADKAADNVADDIADKIHILLVEDEALIAEIIGETLMDAGHAVHSCSNAKDALLHLESGSRVDVLFTDINLPGEMDGAVLAENARKSNPALSVIYASGRWGLLDKLRGLPNAKTLQKPYSPARACEAVQSLAASRSEVSRDPKPAAEMALAL